MGPASLWEHLGSTGSARVPKGAIWHSGACGSIVFYRCTGFWGQNLGRPEIPCGGLWRPSRSPIEEDKMTRFKHPGTQILDSSCLGAWRVGFLDSSCLATWACWTDGLFWPLLRGVGVGKGLDVVGKEVESNTLDALERSADCPCHCRFLGRIAIQICCSLWCWASFPWCTS